jgi:hypothetical protein
MTLATWTAALLLAAGTEAAPTPDSPPASAAETAPPALEKDARALALLHKMSDRLQRAKTVTFKTRSTVEVPMAGGALVLFFTDSSVAVQRPDRLAVTMTGDAPEFRFAYDGKSMTAFTPGSRHWATTAAPPTLDDMLGAAMEQANVFFPFDEMLVADPFATITKDLGHVFLVGQTTFGGRKADHLVLARPGLELQLWLDAATALPRAVGVIYVDQPRTPHFYIEYFDWRLDPRLPASTFALPKPPGAKQIDFRAPAGQ